MGTLISKYLTDLPPVYTFNIEGLALIKSESLDEQQEQHIKELDSM